MTNIEPNFDITAASTESAARPSGTEPKIKFYFSVRTELKDSADFDQTEAALGKKIDMIIEELGLK